MRADPELDALLDTLDDAVSANDNAGEIDLGDLPFNLPHVPVPVVTDLDGTPAEAPAPVPVLVTETPAPTPPAAPSPGASSVPVLVTRRPARPRRLKRCSDLRQREDARRKRAHGRVAEGEAVEHLQPLPSPSSDSTSSKSTTTPTNTPKATTTITTGPTYRRMIAPWDDAGELPRLISINRALGELGQPFAFSLNLAPDLIQAANDNARGALDYLRRRVALGLKRGLGRTPPMWLCLETDDDGRLHLHGGLALDDRHHPGAVEAALAKAGGAWTRKGSAPADVRVQWAPDGWGVYPLKRAARTRRHLREAAGKPPGARVRLMSYSDDLGRAGRQAYEEERRAIGRR